jgi:hypothetical protein
VFLVVEVSILVGRFGSTAVLIATDDDHHVRAHRRSDRATRNPDRLASAMAFYLWRRVQVLPG